MSMSSSNPSIPNTRHSTFRAPTEQPAGLGTWGSKSESEFTDSSGNLFSLYLSHAEKYDRDQTERWKADADGILVFTGLFAAALATFVIDSYKSLLPDSGGNTVVLLAQISRQLDGLSNGNGSHPSLNPSFQFPSQSTFQPPASAVWVNVFWFLSLVISLFCALLATLQQRWARRYLRLTQPQVAIHKRARIRSFFAEGVTRFQVPVAIEAIPALLHVSVFLFLAGLVISLFSIHHTVAYVVLAASTGGAMVYTVITVMPVIYHDCPYTSPFTAPAWYISRKVALGLLYITNNVVDLVWRCTGSARKSAKSPLHGKLESYKTRLSKSMTKAANDAAMHSDSQMDARALGWTLDRLDEESELEEFAAGIPGFARSLEVKDTASILQNAQKYNSLYRSLYRHIVMLLVRAAKPWLIPDSKRLPEPVRQRRMAICLEALYYIPDAIEQVLERVAYHDTKKVTAFFSPILQSVESWLIAERLAVPNKRIDQNVTIGAQCVAAVFATRLPGEEARPILMRHLKIQKSDANTLDHYLEHFDSLLLTNLNRFLKTTALPYIDKLEMEKFDIMIISTVHIIKQLKWTHATDELRLEFETLRAKVKSIATPPSPTWAAGANAKKLLEELSILVPNAPTAAGPSSSSSAAAAAATPSPNMDARSSVAPLAPVYSPLPQASSPRSLSIVTPNIVSMPSPGSPSSYPPISHRSHAR
ncbi:hypothetical protein BJV74DRAFT_797411 [Russula compacta]|nr:hypothetical protein BJV74DRAFT_797411 [Russula compacta]